MQPPGAVFAELKGGYDATNLNLHPAVTEYEIVCPGEVSCRPAEAQIRVEDLSICEDTATDRLVLRSRRLGLEVIPVYLGFLLPMALPEVQQVLLNFSYTGMAQLDLWAGTGVPEPERRRRPAAARPVRLGGPRPAAVERTGRPGAAAPALRGRPPPGSWNGSDGGASTASRGASSSRRRRRGSTSRCTSTSTPTSASRSWTTVVRDDPGVLALTEMLPGPEQLSITRDGRGYVTELTVEIDGVTRGTDRDGRRSADDGVHPANSR